MIVVFFETSERLEFRDNTRYIDRYHRNTSPTIDHHPPEIALIRTLYALSATDLSPNAGIEVSPAPTVTNGTGHAANNPDTWARAASVRYLLNQSKSISVFCPDAADENNRIERKRFQCHTLTGSCQPKLRKIICPIPFFYVYCQIPIHAGFRASRRLVQPLNSTTTRQPLMPRSWSMAAPAAHQRCR